MAPPIGFKPWNKGIKAPQISKAKLGKPRPDMIGHKWNAGKKHNEEWSINHGKDMKEFWSENKNSEIILNRNKKISKKMTGKKKNYQVWSFLDGRSHNPIKRKTIRGIPIANIVWCINNHIHRVPDGCVIHHINGNPINNNPSNLQLLEDKYHRSMHNQLIKLMKGDGIASAV